MSRTFRRKGYESTRKNYAGFKTGGYYTEWDRYEVTGNGHGGYPVFRVMTQQEKNQEYWRIHGESKHDNAWGPGRDYKRLFERSNRYRNKQQLYLELTKEDYPGQLMARYAKDFDSYYW